MNTNNSQTTPNSPKPGVNLWRRRDSLPTMNTAASILLIALSALGAALTTVAGSIFAAILLPAAAAMAALLFVLCRGGYIFTAIPAAYLLAWLFSGSPVTALASLMFAPAALALAAGVYLSFDCSKTVALTAAGTGIFAAILVLIDAASSGLGLSGYFTEIRGGMKSTLTALTVTTEKGTQQVLSDENAELLVTSVVNIAPALVVLLLFFIGFIAAKVFFTATVLMRAGIFTDSWVIKCDMPAAVIYLIAYFTATLLSFVSDAEAAYYAVENVVLVFGAAPIAIGVRVILEKTNRSGSRFMRLIWIFVIGMLFFAATNLTMSITALIGVFVTVRENRKSKDGDSLQ